MNHDQVEHPMAFGPKLKPSLRDRRHLTRSFVVCCSMPRAVQGDDVHSGGQVSTGPVQRRLRIRPCRPDVPRYALFIGEFEQTARNLETQTQT